MSEHTPGPWQTTKPGHLHAETSPYLCVQLGEDESYTTLELKPDDARFIAAAPDLLAACERLLENVKRSRRIGSSGTLENSIEVVRAAVAKAKGESQ